MSNASEVASTYIRLVQRARQGEGEWSAVEDILTADFELRLAGYGGGDLWLNDRNREEWLERLQSLPFDRLETQTVRIFGDEVTATAEQISTPGGNRAAKEPVCFVFDIENQQVRRITVYRSDYSRRGYD